MEENSEVVLRYRDGHTERATLSPIDSDRQVLSIQREDGAAADVPFSLLKAVFFPRMNPDKPIGDPPPGSEITVEFADGEVIRGTANYNPERNGFFLFPHDRTKSDRIFVVNSAIMSIEVEKL
jgi:hypothetical protein